MRWLLTLLAACAVGAPPGFSKGDQWTFPLVDAHDDGQLLTPVFVEGKGPYLLLIDPDSSKTVLDEEIITQGDFPMRTGGRAYDESDTGRALRIATITHLRMGELTISQLEVFVTPKSTFNSQRRRLFGVIGHDVIKDSVVFGFDRERAVAWMTTQEAFKPPAGAAVLEYMTTRDFPLPLTSAKVDGRELKLHFDFGDATSQLRSSNEVGARRALGAADVQAGAVSRRAVHFVEYTDRRTDYRDVDGTLGLNFFQPYIVNVDWHHKRVHLQPRAVSAASTSARFARWGANVPCTKAGCGTIEIIEQQGKTIARAKRGDADAETHLEVVYSATSAGGSALPPVYASFPAGIAEAASIVDDRYRGAKLELHDFSPFPFSCNGCVTTDLPGI